MRTLCLIASCPDPVTHRGRCQRHARQRNKDTSPNKRVYSSKRWKVLRRHMLYLHPLCKCGEIATDVHHLEDIQAGGDPWATANLETMCHECHSRETRRGQG